jgi:hypothetical protein
LGFRPLIIGGTFCAKLQFIDDPKAGWKGRGLWTTNGDRTPWLMEGGKGSKPRVVHFQIRPNPLAK